MKKARRPRIEWIEVTPELAREWLALNSLNRNLRNSQVLALRGAMEGGEYRGDNGELIKLGTAPSGEEVLLDGQHRLTALAGLNGSTRIGMFVAFDVPFEAQETIDTGMKRKVGDMLKLRGHVNANELAAAARFSLGYELYGTFSNSPAAKDFTAQDILRYVEHDRQWLAEAVEFGIRWRRASGLPISPRVVCGLTHQFGRAADPEMAFTFWKKVDQPNAKWTGPALLRARLVRHMQTPNAHVATSLQAILSVKAWNLWVAGTSQQKLQWRPDRDPLPTIAMAGETEAK